MSNHRPKTAEQINRDQTGQAYAKPEQLFHPARPGRPAPAPIHTAHDRRPRFQYLISYPIGPGRISPYAAHPEELHPAIRTLLRQGRPAKGIQITVEALEA